jgi:hypothetical protein
MAYVNLYFWHFLPNFEKSSAKENGAKENYITYFFFVQSPESIF